MSTLTQKTAEVTAASEACLRSAVALEDNAADVPAAFLYLAEGDGTLAKLAAVVGVAFRSDRLRSSRGTEWPLESVLENGLQSLLLRCTSESAAPV